MLQLPGEIKFVRWLDKILPEIIWIGLLQEKLGIKRSIEICCAIAKALKDIYQEQNSTFALISNYKKLTDVQYMALLNSLSSSKMLNEISFSLKPLVILYPLCPLNKLVTNTENDYVYDNVLSEFKCILNKYFYRRAHLTNVMEGTALYMGILAGHVQYVNNTTPPDLNALIMSSPGSALYEKTASAVRSMTVSLVSNANEEWPQYFWNRGLVIDRCNK
jgi:hypothetical protein